MISIRELAGRIDRQIPTIRKWEKNKVLPEHLLPTRDSRGRRYWTEAQVKEIVRWMHLANRTAVKSATGEVAPMSDEQVDRYLEGVRKKRDEIQILRDKVEALEKKVEDITSAAIEKE